MTAAFDAAWVAPALYNHAILLLFCPTGQPRFPPFRIRIFANRFYCAWGCFHDSVADGHRGTGIAGDVSLCVLRGTQANQVAAPV
ncbi:hypothetical protein [Bradyrhizobium guangdongense]|uniref:hypothetical protein n=1 Tax=Bradyrhizobium guangdongense TaxID=1325090 RepID=UPI001009A951|nr:hypothetical protein [Bradyrhizobium guangdongense]